MKRLFFAVSKLLITGFLIFNLSLVALTVFFSRQAINEHPMSGILVHADNAPSMHIIDSAASAASDTDAAANTVDADEPVIVLIHGASTSALDFSTNLYPRISADRRVIAIDRPGHGYSERGSMIETASPEQQALRILNTLDAINVQNVVLVGHSWARAVVMAALLIDDSPVAVEAGVLIAGAVHPWEGGSAWHVEASARPVIGDIFVWQYIAPMGRVVLDSAVASVFLPDEVPENYTKNTGLTLSLRPHSYKANAVDRVHLSSHLEQLFPLYSTIDKPLLSIAASADTVVPMWNHHDRLIDHVPQLTASVIEGAGHSPHHSRTDDVVSAIESFLHELDL